MQETYGHQTKQGAILLWEAPTTWPFNYVTNTPSRDNFKNLYLFLSPVLWLLNLGANLRQEVQHANAQVVTDFL